MMMNSTDLSLIAVTTTLTHFLVLWTSLISPNAEMSETSPATKLPFVNTERKISTDHDLYFDRAKLIMNSSVDPCQDFYSFACGNFGNVYQRPAGMEIWQMWDHILPQDNARRFEDFLTKAGNHSSKVHLAVNKIYKACQQLEKENNKPEISQLQNIAGQMGGLFQTSNDDVGNIPGFSETFSKLFRYSSDSLFTIQHASDGAQHAIILAVAIQPNRKISQQNGQLLIDLISNLLGNSSNSIQTIAGEIIDFEQELGKLTTPSLQFPTKQNFETAQSLAVLCPEMAFQNIFTHINDVLNLTGDKSLHQVLMSERDRHFLRRLCLFVKYSDRRVLHNYLVVKAVKPHFRTMKEAPSKCAQVAAEFMPLAVGTLMEKMAIPTLEARQKIESIANKMLALFVSDVEKFAATTSNSKSISNIVRKIKVRFGYAEWMHDDDKMADFYREYVQLINSSDEPTLTDFSIANYRLKLKQLILSTTLTENIETIKAFFKDQPLHPQAHFDLKTNEVKIDPSLLLPPFFFAGGEPQHEVLNYAGLGYVIGHELAHIFQRKEFAKLMESNKTAIANYYQNTFPGINVVRTIYEDLADIWGLKLAYYILKSSAISGDFNPEMGMSSDRVFFLAYAQLRCMEATHQGLLHYLNEDVHSPDFVRVLGPLGLMDEFSASFSCIQPSINATN